MLEVATDIYHRPLTAVLRDTDEFEDFLEVLELKKLQREEADQRQREHAADAGHPPD